MIDNRRLFLKKSALAGTAMGLIPELVANDFSLPTQRKRLTDKSLIGIKMAANSMFDEGIEPVLDFLSEEAAINTLMIYSHTYYGIGTKPYQVLAKDHIKPPRTLVNRKLPMVWVKHNQSAFKDTPLKHAKNDPSLEYHDRDIFQEV